MTQAQKRKLTKLIAAAKRGGWSKWIRGPIDHAAVLDGCYFDPAAANRAREFFRRFLRLPDQAIGGTATRPFDLLDWQWRDVIAPLFGWKRKDGSRRFRFAWIEIAKKNGKSTLAAALLLYLAIADGEVDAEVYGAALDRKQAGIVFREARRMVKRSPALRDVVEVKDAALRMEFATGGGGGFYEVLPGDADSTDGINSSAVIFDEVHRQRDRALFDTLIYSGSARRQPLFVCVTTAGDDRESIAWELHERAEKVLKGAIVDHEWFAYIAAADLDDPIDKRATWAKANPSLGHTISEDKLAAEAERAKQSPAYERNFRRLRLNQWVGKIGTWLDYDRWAACGQRRVDPDALAGRECYAGMDASSNDDMTALELIFRNEHETPETIDVLSYFWLPEEGIVEKEKRWGVPLRAWADQGLIELTPGDYIDFDFIRRRIRDDLGKRYAIRQVAYDPKYMRDLALRLQDDGFEVYEFWQRRTMTNPVLRLLERLVLEGRLNQGNNPVLNWMASNAQADENADGLIKLVKPTGSQKIDGMDGLSFGLGYTLAGDGEYKPYDGEEPQLIALE